MQSPHESIDPVTSTRAVASVKTVRSVANEINSQACYLGELTTRLEALMNDIGMHSVKVEKEQNDLPTAPGLGASLNDSQQRFADHLSFFENQLDVMSKELT